MQPYQPQQHQSPPGSPQMSIGQQPQHVQQGMPQQQQYMAQPVAVVRYCARPPSQLELFFAVKKKKKGLFVFRRRKSLWLLGARVLTTAGAQAIGNNFRET